jgi:uncharacterized protein DUF4386
MMERNGEVSPRLKARMAGVFELLEGITSASGQVFILGSLIVTGNAAATAAKLLAHERLFWLGFASSLIAVAFHLAWALLFYDVLRPVNRSVARLAVFVILVACALQALGGLLYAAPMLVLTAGSSLSAFSTEQLQALAYVFLKVNAYAFNVYLVFFGFWCALTGYLIFKSTFLPRVLGVLLVIDGIGWMTYLVPLLARHVFPFIAGASAVAEIPLMLWLLVVGLDAQRWQEQARGAPRRT